MAAIYSIRVDGVPVPQPRTRMARLPNGGLRNYDPGTSNGWKEMIAIEAKKVRPPEPLRGPLRVDVAFLFPRPAAHIGKGGALKNSAPAWVSGRGRNDVDNLFKALADILTQIGFWEDDGQIAIALISKLYADPGQRPGAEVRIEVLA